MFVSLSSTYKLCWITIKKEREREKVKKKKEGGVGCTLNTLTDQMCDGHSGVHHKRKTISIAVALLASQMVPPR